MAGLLSDVLPWVYSKGNQARRQLNGLLSDPMGTFESAAQTMQGSHQKLQGLLDQAQAGNTQAQGDAAEMALGGLLGLAPAGIFAGVNAKTANAVALKAAQEMKSRGVKPETIWNQTGWGKGPDGKWRFEIDDSASAFKKDAVQQLNAYGVRQEKSIFDHPALYEAYPQVGNIAVMRQTVHDTRDGVRGSYDGKNSIEMGIPRKKPDMQAARSTNLHELQHAVQDAEGFSPGGSAEQFLAGNRINPQTGQAYTLGDAYNAYRSLAGEAEARMVQERANYTPQQRREIYPWDPLTFEFSTGVPISGLLDR